MAMRLLNNYVSEMIAADTQNLFIANPLEAMNQQTKNKKRDTFEVNISLTLQLIDIKKKLLSMENNRFAWIDKAELFKTELRSLKNIDLVTSLQFSYICIGRTKVKLALMINEKYKLVEVLTDSSSMLKIVRKALKLMSTIRKLGSEDIIITEEKYEIVSIVQLFEERTEKSIDDYGISAQQDPESTLWYAKGEIAELKENCHLFYPSKREAVKELLTSYLIKHKNFKMVKL